MGFKNIKVFYGWWIVTAASLILLTSGPIFYGFTAMIEPISDEFGWSYAQISLAASLRGLESGLLAPVMGALADRWGSKPIIFFGTFVMSLSLVLLSWTSSLWMTKGVASYYPF